MREIIREKQVKKREQKRKNKKRNKLVKDVVHLVCNEFSVTNHLLALLGAITFFFSHFHSLFFSPLFLFLFTILSPKTQHNKLLNFD
jgi:hypothetical protein